MQTTMICLLWVDAKMLRTFLMLKKTFRFTFEFAVDVQLLMFGIQMLSGP